MNEIKKLLKKKQRRLAYLEKNSGMNLLLSRYRLMQEAESIYLTKQHHKKVERLCEIDSSVRLIDKKLGKFWPENSNRHYLEKVQLEKEIKLLKNRLEDQNA